MSIIEKDNSLIISGVADFELADIFDCGQCFRWNKVSENSYFGIAFSRALLIEKSGDDLIFHNTSRSDFDNIWFDYFDFGRDYTAIKNKLSADDMMACAIGYGGGIRILRQDT